MTNSWDWVEKHNKRERQRKRFRIFGIIMMLFFLLFVIGIPPLFKPNDDPPAPQRGKQEIEPVVETQEQQIRQPETDRVAATKIKTENRSPENRNRAPATQTKADLPPLEIAPPPIANSIQVPKEPQPDPAQQRAAERAISKLDRAISHANGNGDRLNSYGGEKWKEIQALARTARESDNPSETIELAEEASSRIAALLPELQYAEFNDQIRGKDSRDVLASIVKFRSSHSDHPRLTDMAKDIAAISREQWLQMAASELEAAAPDDSGFAEGWLPIASAWQLVGNDAEAREALRHAVAALPRMTLPERVIESTIDICQHESFDKAASAQLIESAAEMCKQIASKWRRGSYFANLSGLASKLGHRTLASRLLEQALSPDNMNVEFGVTEKLILTQQARAASWTAKPEAIFSMCSKLEKLNYPKPVYNANAYGHAAIAAARHNDNPQFFGSCGNIVAMS